MFRRLFGHRLTVVVSRSKRGRWCFKIMDGKSTLALSLVRGYDTEKEARCVAKRILG